MNQTFRIPEQVSVVVNVPASPQVYATVPVANPALHAKTRVEPWASAVPVALAVPLLVVPVFVPTIPPASHVMADISRVTQTTCGEKDRTYSVKEQLKHTIT